MSKFNYKILSLLVVLFVLNVLLFISCERDNDIELTTISVTNEQFTPSYTSAGVRCRFTTDATLRNVCLQYSLTSDFTEYEEVAMWESDGSYHASLENLQDNTTYYIRYSVSNRFSSVIVNDVSQFSTLQPSVPTISIDSIGDIWDTHAKTFVNLSFDGGATISKMGICWSTQPNVSLQDNKKEAQTATSVFNMTSLQPNTTYYIRAYAENKKGISYSDEKTFITYALPQVQTSDITDIQLTSAVLAGSLIFDGNDATTIAGLCWGRDPEPTLLGIHQDLEVRNNIFNYTLSNLEDETQYYVRAYARNKIGVVYGDEKSFTTQSAVIPTIITTEVTNISYTTATVGGNITSDGGANITERGICYSTSVNPTIDDIKITSGTGKGAYTVNLTNLTDSTTYHVRAYAINKKGVSYGDEVIFMTDGYTLPEISTSQPTQVSYTSAAIGGVVISDGGTAVLERGICYSTVKHPTIESSKIASGIGIGSFSVNLSNLADSTTYYVRAYAINKKGVSYGEEVVLTTEYYKVPTITTTDPSNVSYTSATLGGNVLSDGGMDVSERGICYAQRENPTISDTKIKVGDGTGDFSVYVTNLADSTTYYVRAYSINQKGIGYGEEVTFMTKIRSIPIVYTSSVTNVDYTSVVVEGMLLDDGGYSIDEYGFCYATHDAPTINDVKIISNMGVELFRCTLNELQEETTYYICAYATNKKGVAYGDVISFYRPKAPIENGHEYVDLGLPSGIKWATCNLGASKAEHYGNYYAWGETNPKSFYNWNSYIWSTNWNGWNDDVDLAKYNTDAAFGGLPSVDHRTTLEASDDAATVVWGGKWRTPTITEWNELCNQCTWILKSQGGINGYLVTSKNNGNSIFLPMAGSINGSTLGGDGTIFNYWSSSLYSSYPINACSLNANSNRGVFSGYYKRYLGFSIRPVCP